MKIATKDLTDAALDWAVAGCEVNRIGRVVLAINVDQCSVQVPGVGFYEPSTDWSQGGPIIEKEWICADRLLNGQWLAAKRTDEGDSMLFAQSGPTPLVAAMRCFVASKLGDEVDVPEELLK